MGAAWPPGAAPRVLAEGYAPDGGQLSARAWIRDAFVQTRDRLRRESELPLGEPPGGRPRLRGARRLSGAGRSLRSRGPRGKLIAGLSGLAIWSRVLPHPTRSTRPEADGNRQPRPGRLFGYGLKTGSRASEIRYPRCTQVFIEMNAAGERPGTVCNLRSRNRPFSATKALQYVLSDEYRGRGRQDREGSSSACRTHGSAQINRTKTANQQGNEWLKNSLSSPAAAAS
jgi:hypothetical protein